jgi:hypothetical protein
VNGPTGAGLSERRAQKGCFLMIAFNEMDPTIRKISKENCGNDTGKAASTAKIDPLRRPRVKLKYLRTIRYMTVPGIFQRRWSNQIDRLCPFLKKCGEVLQLLLCFT